jgi:biotin carboxyl carrier protein
MYKIAVTIEGRSYTVELPALVGTAGTHTVQVNGESVAVTLSDPAQIAWLLIDGRPLEIDYDRNLHWIKTPQGIHTLDIRDLQAAVARPMGGDGRIKAPIPGMITRVWVAAGQSVALGEPLMILEAMKMQNELRAPRAGIVTVLGVSEGQTVARGHILIEIEPES